MSSQQCANGFLNSAAHYKLIVGDMSFKSIVLLWKLAVRKTVLVNCVLYRYTCMKLAS